MQHKNAVLLGKLDNLFSLEFAVEDIAYIIGCSEGTISLWQRGKSRPTKRTLRKLDIFLRLASEGKYTPKEKRRLAQAVNLEFLEEDYL